jgi:hypothetical protein
MSENKKIVEMHGCLVCGRLFNVLAVYTSYGKLVDWTVTSTGARAVPNQEQPLAACDYHTTDEIEAAYKRWKSRKGTEPEDEQEDE